MESATVHQPLPVWYYTTGVPGQLAEPGLKALTEDQEAGSQFHSRKMFQKASTMEENALESCQLEFLNPQYLQYAFSAGMIEAGLSSWGDFYYNFLQNISV